MSEILVMVERVSQIGTLFEQSNIDYKIVMFEKSINTYFSYKEKILFSDFLECLYSTIEKDESVDFRNIDEFFRYLGGCLRNKVISYKLKN